MKLILLLLSFFLSASSYAKSIKWTGCGITRKAFMEEISEAYEKKTGIKVILSGGGATRGIRNVLKHRSDIGGSCRHHLKDGQGNILQKESDVKLIQVAWDAIVVIVNKSNPIQNISITNLKKIIDGKIKNWKMLGGKDQQIEFVSRYGNISGVGHMFRLMAFSNPNYKFRASVKEYNSTGPLELEVENNRAAIAIDGISSAKKRNLKILRLNNINPVKKENVLMEKYDLIRPLYLTVRDDEKRPEVLNLVKFILSEAGQKIISQQGSINLAEGSKLEKKWIKLKSKISQFKLRQKTKKWAGKPLSPESVSGALW